MLAVPAPLTSIHFPLANSYTPPALGPAAFAEGHADTVMTATGTASTAANPAASLDRRRRTATRSPGRIASGRIASGRIATPFRKHGSAIRRYVDAHHPAG